MTDTTYSLIAQQALEAGTSKMGNEAASAKANPAAEPVPREPARPTGAAMTNAIDNLVGNTLPASVRMNNDGSTELLPTPAAVSANTHNANVAEPPSLEDLSAQITGHQSRIDAIREQLDAVNYSRTTGQPDGHRVTGAAREQLEKELSRRRGEIGYTVTLIESTSAARIAWNEARAAEAVSSGTPPSGDPLGEAAKRERAISELAEMQIDGKPIGRVEAARHYDEAQLRERADKLARDR